MNGCSSCLNVAGILRSKSNGTNKADVSYANDLSMTKLLYVCLALTLMAFQCKKGDADTEASGIVGKWKMTHFWASTGSADYFISPAPSDDLFVNFSSNSGFSSNISRRGYDQFRAFKLKDDQQLYFMKGFDKVNASYTLRKDTLYISVFGCIEGCSERFERVK